MKMRERSRANTLLIEVVLVIFFFMCSAGILVQVFADAKLKSREARAINASMLEAENVAEELYHAEDPDAVLAEYGFAAKDGGWEMEKDGYVLQVALRTEETESGMLRTYDITGVQDGKTLVALPSTRFIPGEVSP